MGLPTGAGALLSDLEQAIQVLLPEEEGLRLGSLLADRSCVAVDGC